MDDERDPTRRTELDRQRERDRVLEQQERNEKGSDRPDSDGFAKERAEFREHRICRETAEILEETKIQERFGGRGWQGLEVHEKKALFQECENMCARLEERRPARVFAASDGDMQSRGDLGNYRDGTNEILLSEYLVFGKDIQKLDALSVLFHEQAHAKQRDMVAWELAWDEREKRSVDGGSPARPPSKWAGEEGEKMAPDIYENFKIENRIDAHDEYIAYLLQPAEEHANALSQERMQMITALYLDIPKDGRR